MEARYHPVYTVSDIHFLRVIVSTVDNLATYSTDACMWIRRTWDQPFCHYKMQESFPLFWSKYWKWTLKCVHYSGGFLYGFPTCSLLITICYNYTNTTASWPPPPPPPPPIQAMITDEDITPLSYFAFDAVWVLASAINTTCPNNNMTLPQNFSVINGTTVSDSPRANLNSFIINFRTCSVCFIGPSAL